MEGVARARSSLSLIQHGIHSLTGNRCGNCLQDIFDAGLVLGDTDYRQLSYLHRGKLPGIDIAYLLAGAAYHTDRDTLDAIRPGVLQVLGMGGQ